ncbi:hypothetical protein [Haloferula sp. A504]|uniref:hypothetical protein n=1 Tax=Haloferula sp. A504 TaxID=3373601 RepID=UPI0037C1ABCD
MAADLILSNLGEDFGPASLFEASGMPLDEGDLIQIVIFPGLNSSEIEQLAEEGVESVMAASAPLGSTAVGVGATGNNGGFESVVQTPAGTEVAGLHLLIFNAPQAADADEFSLLRLPGVVPEDEVGGFEGFYTRHLGEASVVFGGESEGGFSTLPATVRSDFEYWIAHEMPEGTPAADLLETADPDFDGRSNLLEYGTGSSAAFADFSPILRLERRVTGIHVRYLRRMDDPTLRVFAESTSSLAGWQPLDANEEISADDVPRGFEWVEQLLSDGSGPVFARVKVERLEE